MKICLHPLTVRACINRITLLLLVATIASMVFFPLPAESQIYRWQDEKGCWHFTEGPGPQQLDQQPPGQDASDPSAAAAPTVKVLPNSSSHIDESSLLWRIDTPDGRPSFILGTIHSTDPRVTRLRPEVLKRLDGSDRFVMEMVLDTEAFMQLGASMLLAPDTDLETMLGRSLYERVVSAMADRQMPEPFVRRLKPWSVMAMLSMPKSTGGQILDMVLYQRASSQGKPTSGLESAAEQLDVFEGLSNRDQIELLKMTLDQLPAQQSLLEQLIVAYAADDLKRMVAIARQSYDQARMEAAQRFMTRLNEARNERMVERIIPYLKQGNSFIAVGALHLAGPRGILSLLDQHAYRIEPVRSGPQP
jgi:uncharacterized protein YbaP (TraB family)